MTTDQVPAGKTDHEEVEGLRDAFPTHHGDGHDVDLENEEENRIGFSEANSLKIKFCNCKDRSLTLGCITQLEYFVFFLL